MAVSIDYELGPHEWAKFILRVDAALVSVGAFGLCGDDLGDLLRSALMVVTEAPRVVVSFDGEPGEWRLILDEGWKSSSEPPKLRIRVLDFEDRRASLPDADGTIELDRLCTATEFGGAVKRAAQTVWHEHGADGYRSRWGREFPIRALRALSFALLPGAGRPSLMRKELKAGLSARSK